jgi:hypothetical protein
MLKDIGFATALLLLLLAGAVSGQEESKKVETLLTVEAQLCTGIEERMPAGVAESFPADVGKVYLWSKVTGAADTTVIKHVWSYQGKEMAVVELPVKSPSWRTWSYKTILPQWTGRWEVKILDAEGEILKAVPFTIKAVEPMTPAEESRAQDTGEAKQP